AGLHLRAQPVGRRRRAPRRLRQEAGHGRERVTDKRCTEEEAIAELRSGMTIGFGGWGSRRKPMSVVRALFRSDLTDLTVVSWGGPDVGLLCAAGKGRRRLDAFLS